MMQKLSFQLQILLIIAEFFYLWCCASSVVVARNLMGGGQKYAGKTLSTMLEQQIKCSTLNIPKHSIAVTYLTFSMK